MKSSFQSLDLTKRFDSVTALDAVTLTIRKPSLIGLLGRNGSGKTTLLKHIVGLALPTTGTAEVLGVPTAKLEREQLCRIGYVPQEIQLLEWMRVEQHIRYVANFYPNWDSDREARLCRELELDGDKHVGALSTGNLQKLAVVLAVCHHPELLVLDEPVSDLDPIARSMLLQFLLEVMREDEAAIVISSHVLRDIEQIVDWVVCLDDGRVRTDSGLDELKEQYSEWQVTTCNGELPQRFPEAFVLQQEVSGRAARLVVRQAEADASAFKANYSAELASRPLNLEQMFPLLLGEDQP